MRKVYLHGALGKEYGYEFNFAVETAAEAIRALHVNLPGFRQILEDGVYEIVRGDIADGMRLDLDEVRDFALGKADLHIVPAIEGSSKGGGVVKTVLGVALIGAALAFSGGTLGAAIGPGLLSGITYGNIAAVGLALTVAGVTSMLAPKRKVANQDSSFALGGPQNTYAQGNPVPLVYGRMIVGSTLISSGLSIEPIPVGWDPTNGNTNIGTGGPGSPDPILYTGPMQKITFIDGGSTYGGGGGGSSQIPQN